MAEEITEICGFLDVKYLGKARGQKLKKRTLGSWKVWKRHWCSIKKLGPGSSVKVQFDYGISNSGMSSPHERDNSMIIPSDAIICRTQSRSKQFAFGVFSSNEKKPLLYLAGNSEMESQRWMANIRQLLRPRKHRFLPGSYSISVVDNAHSKTSGLTGLHGDLVASTIGIFIKDAHSGEIVENFEWKELGQFHLITAGRPEDVKCICVIHTTKEFRGGIGVLHVFCLEAIRLLQDLVTQGRGPKNRQCDHRPLSLSEGDLRISAHDEILHNNRFRYDSTAFRAQVRTENVYQPEPPVVSNGPEELNGSSQNRRMSNISMASGIYEEIADDSNDGRIIMQHSFVERFLRSQQLEQPPPLPPRQRCSSESMTSRTRGILNLNGGIRCVVSSQGTAASGEEDTVACEKAETCNYVPMSSQLKKVNLEEIQSQASPQENDYVIMR